VGVPGSERLCFWAAREDLELVGEPVDERDHHDRGGEHEQPEDQQERHEPDAQPGGSAGVLKAAEHA
jgi:hypothetical protein